MSNSTTWSQKHQPKTLDECVLEGFPAHVQASLRKIDASPSIPNILLYGIAGTGKSTIARILANKPNHDRKWFNGSLMKKEDVAVLNHQLRVRTLFADQPLVFIDEADGLTKPAQYALRSLIEPTVEASWIFTCNFKKGLIDPIQSRFLQIECALPKTEDKPAHVKGIVRRCKQILDAEDITGVDEREIEAIAYEKYPDIRATINELQMRYFGLAAA